MYNSIQLIRKDIMLVRKFLLLLIPYFIFMAYMNLDNYSVLAIFPSMILLMNTCSLDAQQINQRFLVSLPVSRRELVFAKYLSILPLVAFGFLSNLLIYGCMSVFGADVSPDFWQETSLAETVFPILASVYLPLYFWLGSKGSQVVNVVFMMFVLIGSNSISTLLPRISSVYNWLGVEDAGKGLSVILMAIGFLLVIGCSYLVSLKIYERKEV